MDAAWTLITSSFCAPANAESRDGTASTPGVCSSATDSTGVDEQPVSMSASHAARMAAFFLMLLLIITISFSFL